VCDIRKPPLVVVSIEAHRWWTQLDPMLAYGSEVEDRNGRLDEILTYFVLTFGDLPL